MRQIVERNHRRIFSAPPSKEMLAFVDNIGIFSLGAFFSGVFLFIFNLLAGRLLGPSLYGQFQISLSYGGLFAIPMAMGINLALVRFVAPEKDPAKQQILFSSAAVLVGALTLSLSLVLLLFSRPFSAMLNISHPIYVLSIGIAIASSLFSIPKGMIYSLHKFRLGSFVEMLTGFLNLGIFLLLYIRFSNTANTPIIARITATAVITLLLMYYLRRFVRPIISRSIAKLFFQYGIFSMMNVVILFLLANIDRILLNWYRDLPTVGVYTAYMSAATFGSSAFLQIFNTVFFPTMSRQKEKKVVLDKMLILAKKFGFLAFIGSMIAIPVILKLFGSEYSINLLNTALIALSVTFSIGWQILAVFLSSEGVRGTRATTALSMIAAIVLIVLSVMLIPKMGVLGAIVSVLASNALLLFLCLRKARQYTFSMQPSPND